MLFGCNAEVFDGNSVKNQDNFFLRFTRMSKTDAHIITAEAGDVISVELEIEKGRVDIVIGAEGDEPIYFGNDVDSGKSELRHQSPQRSAVHPVPHRSVQAHPAPSAAVPPQTAAG